MSDRNIREMLRATQQRLTRIERVLSRLNLHVWPGAVRSVSGTVAGNPGSPQTFLSLDIPSGRWRLTIRGQIFAEDTPGNEVFNARVVAPTGTGLLPTWRWGVPHTAGRVFLTICDEGDIITDVTTTLELQCWTTNTTTVEWSDLMIFAQPV
jgi:hypothetical protein